MARTSAALNGFLVEWHWVAATQVRAAQLLQDVAAFGMAGLDHLQLAAALVPGVIFKFNSPAAPWVAPPLAPEERVLAAGPQATTDRSAASQRELRLGLHARGLVNFDTTEMPRVCDSTLP